MGCRSPMCVMYFKESHELSPEVARAYGSGELPDELSDDSETEVDDNGD
jgi:hypothetical protein